MSKESNKATVSSATCRTPTTPSSRSSRPPRVGAIWSACAQDYAAEGAGTKLGQLEPKVLFAADGYLWNGQAFDRRDQVADLANRMPSLRAVVGVGNLGEEFIDEHGQITNLTAWDDIAFRGC